jgi:uncharacterized protein
MFPVQSPPPASLNPVAWVLIAAIVAYMAMIAPIRGRRAYRRIAAGRGTDPQALLRSYRRIVARDWLLMIPIALIMAIAPRASLGFAWPHTETDHAWQVFVVLCVVIALSTLTYRTIARTGGYIPGQRLARMLLPETTTEKRWAYAVAATAGITEEVLFRGLILNAGIWAGLPIALALLVSSVLFGVIHIYQGVGGVVLTTLAGLLFGWFYLATLSLLMPVVLHVLIDLRALAWVPAPAPTPPPPPPAPRPAIEDGQPRPSVRNPFPTA